VREIWDWNGEGTRLEPAERAADLLTARRKPDIFTLMCCASFGRSETNFLSIVLCRRFEARSTSFRTTCVIKVRAEARNGRRGRAQRCRLHSFPSRGALFCARAFERPIEMYMRNH
jgi:hypothetical protein